MKILVDTPEKRLLWVILFFTILTLVYTYPLVIKFSSHIPGYSGDINQYYWCHWWFKESMERGLNPWYTDMQFSPNGTPLVFSTNRFGSAAAGWFLTPALGLVGSYNFIIILSFVLTALSIFLLCRELTGSDLASIAAAVVFTFNPWKTHKLMCHHFLMATYIFGFGVLLLMRAVKGKRRILSASLLAILSAFTLYESLFFFDFLFLTLVIILAWLSIFERPAFWRKETLVTGLVFAGIFVLLSIPMLLMIMDTLPQYGRNIYGGGASTYSNDVLNLLIPSPFPWQEAGEKISGIFTSRNHTYPPGDENFGPFGWLTLPLLFYGIWVGRKKSSFAWICLLGVILFALLSLGPVLKAGGSSTGLPMLYSFLSWLPPINLVRAPSRFIIIALLFASILVAYAVSSVLEGHGKWRTAAGAVIVALLIFDYFPRAIATQDQEDVPLPIRKLANIEGDFTLLPLNFTYVENMRYAPLHEKPMVSGYTSRTIRLAPPIKEFPAEAAWRLSIFAMDHSESERLPNMAANVRRLLDAWNIGAILIKSKPERAQLLAEHITADIESAENDVHLLLLKDLSGEHESKKPFIIDAVSWPRMYHAGLDSGHLNSIMWTYRRGFDLALPETLMPKGLIGLRAASSIRYLRGLEHEIDIYVNNRKVSRLKLDNKMTLFHVQIPDTVERLPVNIIRFVNVISTEEELSNQGWPESIEVVSANLESGSIASLKYNGTVSLTLEHRPATVYIAHADTRKKRITHLDSVNPHDEDAAGILEEKLLRSDKLIIFSCGYIGRSAASTISATLEKLDVSVKPRRIAGSSFVSYIDRTTGTAKVRLSRDTPVNITTGHVEQLIGPVAGIGKMEFR